MGIQSVVFPKKHFTLKEAKVWIVKNGYKLSFYGKPVDVTKTQYRFRQTSPKKYKNYKITTLKNKVQLVVGY